MQLQCSALCTPAPIPASERRRATPRVVHPGDPRRPSAALLLARSRGFQCNPSRSPSSRSERTERTLARHAQRRPSFIARPSFLAPRSSRTPIHLALHLLCLIPCLIELIPGRIGLSPSSRTRPPLPTSIKLRSELRPSRRRPPSGLPSRKTNTRRASPRPNPTPRPLPQPNPRPPPPNRRRAAVTVCCPHCPRRRPSLRLPARRHHPP